MLDIIKDSFEITNKNIILATPLILFTLLSTLYLVFLSGGNQWSLIFAVALFVLMIGAFLSGWFYMVKQSILSPDRDDINSLIKDFPAGVGEYFLSILGFFALVFIIEIVAMVVSNSVGMRFIGDIGITTQDIAKSAENPEAFKTFVLSLSQEQLVKLKLWNILLFTITALTTFVLMFFPQALFFKEKNPLKAFFESLKCLFGKKFFVNVLLFLLVLISYVVLSILTTMFGASPVVHFIFTLLNFYYLVFVAVLMFNYYYKNFVKFDKTV